MRILAAALLTLAWSGSLLSQQFVYPRPDPSKITVKRNIPYQKVAGRELTFDIYRPAGSAVVPVVITANVGINSMKSWPGYVGWGEVTAAAGLASVQYDGTEDWNATFAALMKELRARADELKIDPSRVVLWGGSTNVRLALPFAMDPARDYIRGAVIYYGATEVPELHPGRPVFFVRAGLDGRQLNERIDVLLARAIRENAPWTIENYGGGLHGFDIFNDNDVSREIIRRTLDFMNAVTNKELALAYTASAADARLAAAFSRGDWAAAIEGYTSKVKSNPRDGESHLRLGEALYQTGRYDDALRHMESAWELGRRGPRDTALPAARAAARAGKIDRAAHWLGVILRTPFVTEEQVRADEAFSGILENEAIRELLTALAAQNELVALFAEGEGEAAIRRLRETTNPHLVDEATLNVIGYRVLGTGKAEDSISVFRIAAERYPRSANAWESLSEAQEAAGRKADAVESVRRALALDPPENVRVAAQSRLERLASP